MKTVELKTNACAACRQERSGDFVLALYSSPTEGDALIGPFCDGACLAAFVKSSAGLPTQMFACWRVLRADYDTVALGVAIRDVLIRWPHDNGDRIRSGDGPSGLSAAVVKGGRVFGLP